MSTVLNCVNERINELTALIAEKEASLKNVPEGTLKICKTNKRTQFYLKTHVFNEKGEKKETCKFIKKSEKKLVQVLCQKDYDRRVLLSAQNELKQLEKLKKNYPLVTPETIYENMNEERQKYTSPIRLPDDMYISQWKAESYEQKSISIEGPDLLTDAGE